MAESLAELKEKTALAHRILTMAGSMGDITGHVMTRVPGTDQLIVRCRGEEDWSPRFARPECMHTVDMDGRPAEEMGDYLPPPERWIGVEVLRARPEVNCVIHAHPPAQVRCSVSGVEVRPVLGSANSGGARLAFGGIPVYPRTGLVASPAFGRAVVAKMGAGEVCLLKAHGNVVTGRSVEEATVRAIKIECLAQFCWEIAAAGKTMDDIPWEDVEEMLYPTQEAAQQVRRQGGDRWTWKYYERVLREGAHLNVEYAVHMG